MKNYLIVFVMAMGLLVGFQFGISAQDSPAKMQELQKKIGDSQTLYESKKYAEAIPLMESILKEYPIKKNGFRVTMTEFEGGHTLPTNYFDVLKEAILWFHTEPTTK